MPVRPICLIPDPVLRVVCDPVIAFDDALRGLAADMLDTMYAAPGRGLAAPQVGVTDRVFVMDTAWKEGQPDPQVFVNPHVLQVSGDMATLDEGCLSIPDQLVSVTRPAVVTLGWQDLDGAAQSQAFTGFAAACVQHELDHLNGVLCTDYEGAA